MRKSTIILSALLGLQALMGPGAWSQPTGSIAFNDSDRSLFDHFFLSSLQAKFSGDFQKSIECLQTCYRLERNNPAVCYEIARLLSAAHQFETACRYADECVRLDSTNNAYYIQAAIDANLGADRKDKAIALYDRLIKVRPKNLELYLDKADVMIEAEDYDNCLNFLSKAPQQPEAFRYECDLKTFQCYQGLGDLHQCERLVKALYKENPDKARTNYLYFVVLSDRDPQRAIQYCRRATELPDGETFFFHLANYYRQQRMDSLYSETILRFFKLSTVTPEAKKMQLYSLMTSPDGMATNSSWRSLFIKILRSLEQQYPGDTQLADMQSGFYSLNGEEGEALASLVSFVNKYPADDNLWRKILSLSTDKLDAERMLDYSRRAQKDVPREPFYAVVEGQYLNQLGRHNEAIKRLRYACDAYWSRSDDEAKFYANAALNEIANSYYDMDSLDATYGIYEQLLAKDPDDAMILNNYAYRLATHGRDLDRAEKMIMRCLNVEPLSSTYLDTYAYVLYRRQKFQEALFVMERCIAADGDKSSEIYDHYGDILFALGREREGLEQWAKASALEPKNDLIKRKIAEKRLIKE